MKAWVKGIIAGAVIAAVGTVTLIAGLYANGWKYPTVEYEYETKTYVSEDATVTALNIDVDLGAVKTEFYEGDTITVEYPTCKVFSYSFREKGGTLYVETVNKSFFWHPVNLNTANIPATVIKLPQEQLYRLNIDLDAGSITLADGAYGSVTLNIDAGSFAAGAVNCSRLFINLDAGSAKAENVKCDFFGADVDAGTLNIGELTATEVSCEMDAGTATFGKITGNRTDLKISAGKLTATFASELSEYNILVVKKAGTCNAETQSGTTEKWIYVTVKAGKVELHGKAE